MFATISHPVAKTIVKTSDYYRWRHLVRAKAYTMTAQGYLRFDGDKDICQALIMTTSGFIGIGEWDGETGYVY